MTRAYKDEWIRNRTLRETAKEFSDAGLLAEDEIRKIDETFPENYYHPGIFVRIGLFLFALLASGFTFGFFMLFVIDDQSNTGMAVICIVSAIGYWFFLHRLIKVKKLLYAGVDTALLYSVLLCVAIVPFLIFDSVSVELASSGVLILTLTATYFYADRLVLLISFTAFLTLLFNLLVKVSFGTALLPFAVAICCMALLQLIKYVCDLYYESCVVFARAVLLLMLYASCNYLVVREGNAMLHHMGGQTHEIPGAPLFWLITFLVPTMYLGHGIRKKSRTLIRTGLLTLLASFYTFYHVYPFLPGPEASLLAGVVLIVLSASAIRGLRTPRYGMSDVSDKQNKLAMIEMLLASRQASIHQPGSDVKFGGGSFGGGGAGNSY